MTASLCRKQPRRVLVLLAVLFWLPTGRSFGNQTLESQIDRRSNQINQLIKEKKDTQSLIEELKKREWGVVEGLTILNNNIAENQRKLNRIQSNIQRLEDDINLTESKINFLEQEIADDETRIRKELHALFYLRKMKNLTLFVGVNSLEHFFRNQKLIQLNAELDAKLVSRHKNNLNELEQEAHRFEVQKANLSSLKRREEEQKKILSFEKEQQQIYLHHIRQDKSIRLTYLREIQVELERLNDVIHSLETKKVNEKKTRQFKGLYRYKHALASPVSGKIVHKFKQKSSKYYTLFKRGVLIETLKNEKVFGILPGKVVWSGPFRGYRNLIILDHGKGSFSVYGNLEEVFVIVDDVVDKNELLGTVAFNDVEESYLFYFETRYNKKAINPDQWLKRPAWKR